MSAEHGPYEESDGDPAGGSLQTSSSNFRRHVFVCISLSQVMDPSQVIIRPDIVEITGPRVVTEGGHVR